jgi:hypothetical protein
MAIIKPLLIDFCRCVSIIFEVLIDKGWEIIMITSLLIRDAARTTYEFERAIRAVRQPSAPAWADTDNDTRAYWIMRVIKAIILLKSGGSNFMNLSPEQRTKQIENTHDTDERLELAFNHQIALMYPHISSWRNS